MRDLTSAVGDRFGRGSEMQMVGMVRDNRTTQQRVKDGAKEQIKGVKRRVGPWVPAPLKEPLKTVYRKARGIVR